MGASQGKETLLRVLPQWEQLQAHMVTGIGQERLVPFLAQLAWTSNSSFFYADRRYTPEEGEDRRMRRVLLTQEGEQALKRAWPLWQEAQARIECALGRERFDALLTELSAVRALIR